VKKKGQESRNGYGKLLDAWLPPEDAGSPIGCVATTFTFNPVFFEKECLSRFLGLETDATETPTAYLIEGEEKAANIDCAAVLVDQHQVSKAIRSLRWDLLVARPPRGTILHAKVSLLLWSNRLRVIVGSANLTEPGYRDNHEVFAVLEYFNDSPSPLSVLDDLITFLHDAATLASTDGSPSPAVNRWNGLLNRASTMSKKWGRTSEQRDSEQPRVFAILTGDRQVKSVFDQMQEKRFDKSALHTAVVISPFYDDADSDNKPALRIWDILKQRGRAEVQYQVTVIDDSATSQQLEMPDVRKAFPANRGDRQTTFARLVLEEDRPLHAKCLWFENDNTILSMIGSSNFTSLGLGLRKLKNVEANLCFEVNFVRQPKLKEALEAAWLKTDECFEDDQLRFKPRKDCDEDAEQLDSAILHEAFCDAIFSRDNEGHGSIEFVFQGEPPSGWTVFVEDTNEVFVTETAWAEDGKQPRWHVAWQRPRPPVGFEVSCPAAGPTRVWWPVSVESDQSLSPPDELKNLPLELLIEVLTSSRPLHQVLAKHLERQTESDTKDVSAERDPHRRVDTSQFLLQRTRRVSWALRALRERLEKPIASEQALCWRLRGPIGVLALARAITDQMSPIERGFFLAELCLELHRAQPQTEDAKCLPVKTVRAAIRQVIEELRQTIPPEALDPESVGEFAPLAKYVGSVVEKVLA